MGFISHPIGVESGEERLQGRRRRGRQGGSTVPKGREEGGGAEGGVIPKEIS